MKSAQDSHARGWTRTRNWIMLILLVIVGVAAYLSFTGSWSLGEALRSFSETSQDAATTTKVKTALALSRQVSAFSIGVESRGGKVILSGDVPSDKIRSLAEAIAKDTSGVEEVDNQIMVNPSAEENSEAERLAGRVEDLETKINILDALKRSQQLSDKRIDVQIQNHSVTLTGTVETPEQKREAERIAWQSQGTQGVTNSLVSEGGAIESESPDDKLARRIEFELYSTKAFPELQDMQIQSKDGDVILSGAVSSIAEKLLAANIALSVKGVRSVSNHLSVTEQEKLQPVADQKQEAQSN
jgi:osmotically-inducible protein OsmY